jgi:hypothetical protein
MSSKDKILISDMMESFVSEVPAKPFVTFCEVCKKGVISEEMIYEKGRSFHKDCYTKYGKNFPAINQDLLSQSTNAKVELVQLKNLKVRMIGTNPSPISIPRIMKKSKRKIKKQRPKKRMTKKKRKISKRLTIKKKSSRNRRISTKRTTSRRVSKRRTSLRR